MTRNDLALFPDKTPFLLPSGGWKLTVTTTTEKQVVVTELDPPQIFTIFQHLGLDDKRGLIDLTIIDEGHVVLDISTLPDKFFSVLVPELTMKQVLALSTAGENLLDKLHQHFTPEQDLALRLILTTKDPGGKSSTTKGGVQSLKDQDRAALDFALSLNSDSPIGYLKMGLAILALPAERVFEVLGIQRPDFQRELLRAIAEQKACLSAWLLAKSFFKVKKLKTRLNEPLSTHVDLKISTGVSYLPSSGLRPKPSDSKNKSL